MFETRQALTGSRGLIEETGDRIKYVTFAQGCPWQWTQEIRVGVNAVDAFIVRIDQAGLKRTKL